MQKEAFFAKTQTLTIRNETEWPETISAGYNRLVDPKKNLIYKNVKKYINSKGSSHQPYGVGKTAMKIMVKLKKLMRL
jgi:UDP-GlcNAc3NAcA epimerase